MSDMYQAGCACEVEARVIHAPISDVLAGDHPHDTIPPLLHLCLDALI